MQRFFILISFVWTVNFTFSQNFAIERLQRLLTEHPAADTGRVNLLNQLAYELRLTDIDQILKYATEADSIAGILNYKSGKAESLRYIAFYYDEIANYPSALDYYFKSLTIDEEMLNNKGMALNFSSIGVIYYYTGDYPKAIEYLEKSLQYFEVLDDKEGISACNTNLGLIYFEQRKFAKALAIYHKSLDIYEVLSDSVGIANTCNNIGMIFHNLRNYSKAKEFYDKALHQHLKTNNRKELADVYNNLGVLSYDKENYKEALENHQKSLGLYEEIINEIGIISSYNNIGNASLKQKQFSRAFEYFTEGLNRSIAIGSKSLEGWNYFGLGQMYLEQSKNHAAYDYCKRANILANETGEYELIIASFEALSESAYRLGKHKEAYQFIKLFKTFNDSLNSFGNINEILNSEYQNRIEKERELAKVNEEKHKAESKYEQLQIILLFILILFVVVIIMKSYISKLTTNHMKAINLETAFRLKEKETLLRELHHRVKNNLQVVYSMLNIQSRKITDPEAISALQSSINRIEAMALIHHQMYRGENLTKIKMKDYLIKLTKNVLDSFTVDNGGVKINCNVEEFDLEADMAIPLGLIINELIINAMKHAFKETNDPQLDVSLNSDNNKTITLQIKDNGCGLPESIIENGSSFFGLELVKMLTSQLKGSMTISNTSGTCFTISVEDQKPVTMA